MSNDLILRISRLHLTCPAVKCAEMVFDLQHFYTCGRLSLCKDMKEGDGSARDMAISTWA